MENSAENSPLGRYTKIEMRKGSNRNLWIFLIILIVIVAVVLIFKLGKSL